jgi:hypothetical protein
MQLGLKAMPTPDLSFFSQEWTMHHPFLFFFFFKIGNRTLTAAGDLSPTSCCIESDRYYVG